MTQEEIEQLKQKVAVTLKATRPFVLEKPAAPGEEVQRSITLTATRVFGGQQVLTPFASEEYWKTNHADWVNKMEQAKQYFIIYNATLTLKEMQNICLVTYKYICFMSTLPDYTDYQLKESEMITKRLDPHLYNITKRIAWLAQKWPEIQQYLLTGNLYLMGEAHLEAPSSREVSFESETEETEQPEYTLSEEKDLEAAKIEAEKQKYIFQQPPAGQPPPLKKGLDKWKQLQFQGYTQRSGDGNQTPTKDRSKKQAPKETPSLYSHSGSRTGGSKKAGRTKRPSDDDADDDPSLEGSDAGRDADRSGSDNEPDKETAAEESDRSVREITPLMGE